MSKVTSSIKGTIAIAPSKLIIKTGLPEVPGQDRLVATPKTGPPPCPGAHVVRLSVVDEGKHAVVVRAFVAFKQFLPVISIARTRCYEEI